MIKHEISNKFEIRSLGIRKEVVYDIEVEDNHNFFANDILVHNSTYITMESIVDKHFSNLSTDGIVTALDRFSEKYIIPFINSKYEELADYTNAHKQKMSMKREIIANKAVHTGKKRYIMNVLDDEGVRLKEPKLKMMGIEAVRSSTPEVCRNAIKDVVRLILQGEEKDVHNYVADFKKTFYNMPIEDIAFPRSVNEYDKWISNLDNKSSSISALTDNEDIEDSTDNFSPEKGTPIWIRGSIVYNNFISNSNIIGEDSIKSGDKIKFCYLEEPNVLSSYVISFPQFLPKEFNALNLKLDYKTQFHKSFIVPIITLLDACGWSYERKITLSDFFE